MIHKLYDLVVYITNNYSSMPEEFKIMFPEAICVKLRLFVSNLEDLFNDDEK